MRRACRAEAGYRYSDYSLDFSTDTYKLGLEWTPIQDIRARASYQRAVRVPNVDGAVRRADTRPRRHDRPVCERRVGGRDDRADGRAVRPHRRERGPVRQHSRRISAAQYNGFVGGNPDLQPEKADTLSFGLAFQPSFAPGLRLQMDYFDISIEDAIQAPNADFSVLMCALTAIRSTCARIQRDR